MPFIPVESIAQEYDIVAAGSGFGTLFFIEKAMRLKPDLKVLILEWGAYKSHAAQLKDLRNGTIPPSETFENRTGKTWNFTIGYGGGTNCWFAQTPRLHPNDFKTATLYGVGQDWPIGYDDLESHYCEAEAVMQVAGPGDITAISPRSRPFPQPQHRLSTPDEIMKAAQPEHHFSIPTARARIATGTRSACCASSRCNLCPVDAKFTAENGFRHLLDHPNISILTGAKVTVLSTTGGTVTEAVFETEDREASVRAPLFVLGANAIHSTAILLRSGLGTSLTGVGINEQVGFNVEVLLKGVKSFDGSTITTGLNYALTDGPFRRDHGGALIYFENRWRDGLRLDFGRWRETLPLTIVVEDPPSDDNTVTIDDDGDPVVTYRHSAYAERGVTAALAGLNALLSPLPVEDIIERSRRATESHIQSTLRMGHAPDMSVVDAGQIHHRFRNLIVVGSSVFPSCPTANPSLTVAAMSMRAAEKAFA
jgi:choline dehydrogenase-like flavoprotein